MIISFMLWIGSYLLQTVYSLAAVLSFVLQMPYITVQVTNALAYFIAPIYYFQGVMPVNDMLDFIGRVVGFYSVVFVFNAIMYIWSKVPVFGRSTAYSSDKRS